jgi:hypothetical protein
MQIKLGMDSNEGKVEESPHATCLHVKDIIIILNETNKILTKKMEIKYYETLRKQMSYAEERASLIEGEVLKIYISLLQSANVQNPIESESFEAYRLILSVVRIELINVLRIIFREHDFAALGEMDFNSFVEGKVSAMIAQATASLNQLYFIKSVVTRDQSYKANMDRISEIKAMIREVFVYARKIALEHKQRLEELDTKLELAIKKIIGG